MTRAELHNIPGFHAQTLLAAAAFLRELIPRRPDGLDATALIRNEGRMVGYLDAVDQLMMLTVPEPPQGQKKEYQPYSAPQPQTENPNRK